MFEATMMTLALNLTALTTVYWVCLIVGGGLLVVSTVLGSHADADIDAGGALDAIDGAHMDADFGADIHGDFDADISADVHADVGADTDLATHAGHADAGHGALAGLSTWFSIRFLVFAVAVFGALGVILTHLTETGAALVLAIALAGGVAVGQCVHQLLRSVRRTSGDSTPQPWDYVNKLARVTIAINPPNKGQVALLVGQTRRYVAAVAYQSQAAFDIGDEVVVVAYRAGIAEVISRSEHEAYQRSNRGGAP
jgi:hypothetical protein